MAKTSEFTILAVRLDDPAGLFTLRGDESTFEAQVDLMRMIALSHWRVIQSAFQSDSATATMAILEPTSDTEIWEAAPFGHDTLSRREAAKDLRALVDRKWVVAAFEEEEDALRVAIRIQQRTRESVTQTAGARLQCAIVLSREDPPRGLGVLVGARRAKDRGELHTEFASKLLADPIVVGGRIVCDRQVYEALIHTRLYELCQWETALRETPGAGGSVPREFWRILKGMRSAFFGDAEPMECLYDDGPALLNAPFERVFAAEVDNWIRPRRRDSTRPLPWPDRPHPDNELAGLALSGGGMRSAVFSLGALQALAEHGFLDHVDYMSTVSGGAYVGSSLSSLWAEPLPYENLARLDATTERFPYAQPRPLGTSASFLRSVHGAESPALTHIRANAKLLGHDMGLFDAYAWSWAGQYLAAVVLLWALFLLPITTLIGLGALGLRELMSSSLLGGNWSHRLALASGTVGALALAVLVVSAAMPHDNPWPPRIRAAAYWLAFAASALGVVVIFGAATLVTSSDEPWTERAVILGAVAPLILFAVGGILSSIAAASPWRWLTTTLSASPVITSRTGLALSVVLLFSAAVWGFDWLVFHFSVSFGPVDVNGTAAASTAGTGGLFIAGFSLNKLWDDYAKSAVTSSAGKLTPLIWKSTLAIGGYVALGLAFTAWFWFLWQMTDTHHADAVLWAVISAAAVVLMMSYHPFGRGILNHFSLNRAYSDMIQAAWIIAAKPEDAATPRRGISWARVWPRRDITMQKLREIGGHPPNGPYHLICAALNLPGSTSSKLLDRKSESFVIAPIYSGSALTRWLPTKRHDRLNNFRLAEAAAVSGAAVSPNMGSHTSRTISILTTLFNIRMGRWIMNPRPSAKPKALKFFTDMPLVLYWKEMLGLASHEDGQVYLSDGGHFENLGLYELLRRRCKYIIAISADCGALDEGFDMGNLGNALRLARVDFGIEVEMGSLQPLLHDKESGCVKSFFAAGTICYPGSGEDPDKRGILIFVKTGIIEEKFTADLIKFLRDENKAFPYNSTTDQQYDQPKFESYRKLGYIATCEMWKAGDTGEAPDRDWVNRFAQIKTAYDEIARSSNDTESRRRPVSPANPRHASDSAQSSLQWGSEAQESHPNLAD